MKTLLKYISIIFIALALIYIGLCALGPKNFNTDVSTQINAPTAVVFNLVNSVQKHALWNDWSLRDTAMSITYNHIDYGVGAESFWDSPTQGKGKQKIVESKRNEKVSTRLQMDGWDGFSTADFIFTNNKKKTNLQWTFRSSEDLPFLMRGFFMVMGMKGSMKKSYETGVANIKKIAEERAQRSLYNGYTITLKTVGERNYVIKRGEIPMDNAQQFYANSLSSLFAIVQEAGIDMNGRPRGLYYKWDFVAETADMAAAIPVKEPISIDGATSLQLAEGSVIQIDHIGDSESSAVAHFAIEDYMRDNSLFQELPIVEEYITDSSTEKDPSNWLTRITYYYSN